MKQKLESIINKGKMAVLASIVALAIYCQPLHDYVEPEVKDNFESEVKRLVGQSDGFYGYIILSDGISTGGTPPSGEYTIGHDFD